MKLVKFSRKKCREPIETKDNNLLTSLIRVFKQLYSGDFKYQKLDKDSDELVITKMFVFGLTWSVCCACDELTCFKLEQFASNMFQLSDLPQGELNDSFIDFSLPEPDWIRWESVEREFKYDI